MHSIVCVSIYIEGKKKGKGRGRGRRREKGREGKERGREGKATAMLSFRFH